MEVPSIDVSSIRGLKNSQSITLRELSTLLISLAPSSEALFLNSELITVKEDNSSFKIAPAYLPPTLPMNLQPSIFTSQKFTEIAPTL